MSTTNIEVKRRQIHEERRKRLMNAGVKEEDVDLVIAREDYERLPVEKKLERLETLIVRNSQALASDILTIRGNQVSLANAMDENFEAFARMLVQLGIPADKQREFIQEAAKALEAQRAAQRAQTEAAAVEQAVDQPAPEDQPEQLQEGVQVFGE